MKKHLAGLLLLLTTSTLYSQNYTHNKALIIGIDGVRPDALRAANTPNLDKLAANGTYSWDALNEGKTSSGPGWSNILTGVWQDKHGVTNNSFSGSNYKDYPPLFKYLEDHSPEWHTVSICEWHPINDKIVTQYADETINTKNPAHTEATVISHLINYNPDVMFIHLDSPDGAGHGYGFSTNVPQYISTIEAVDASIGKMLEALEKRENRDKENWLIAVTTDHGGKGQSHGGDSLEERNVFVIISGDEVPQNQIEKTTNDPTEIPPAENCLGDEVELYFDGTDDYIQLTETDRFDFGTSQDFSVEVRIRTSEAADVSIVGNKNWQSGRNKGFVFSFSGGTWKVNVGDGGASSRVDANGNSVSDNEWHTLSATFDRDGDLILYEDGQQVAKKSMAGIGDISTGLPLSIGADALNAYAYEGYIAEVRIFNQLLSADDINSWACKPLQNTHSKYENLIGYWRLADGMDATEAKDLSPNPIHGAIHGATWQDATDTETLVTYDYSHTPRQVDVVASVLEHMCVTNNPDWKLDGAILGSSCPPPTPITGMESASDNSPLQVYPNPVRGGQNLTLLYKGNLTGKQARIRMYDTKGRAVFSEKIKIAEKMNLNIGAMAEGNYTLVWESGRQTITKKQIQIKAGE